MILSLALPSPAFALRASGLEENAAKLDFLNQLHSAAGLEEIRVEGAQLAYLHGYTETDITRLKREVVSFQNRVAMRLNVPPKTFALEAIEFMGEINVPGHAQIGISFGKRLVIVPSRLPAEALFGELEWSLAHEFGHAASFQRWDLAYQALSERIKKAIAGSEKFWADHDHRISFLAFWGSFEPNGLEHPYIKGLKLHLEDFEPRASRLDGFGVKFLIEFLNQSWEQVIGMMGSTPSLSEYVIVAFREFMANRLAQEWIGTSPSVRPAQRRDIEQKITSVKKIRLLSHRDIPAITATQVWASKIGFSDLADQLDQLVSSEDPGLRQDHEALARAFSTLWDSVELVPAAGLEEDPHSIMLKAAGFQPLSDEGRKHLPLAPWILDRFKRFYRAPDGQMIALVNPKQRNLALLFPHDDMLYPENAAFLLEDRASIRRFSDTSETQSRLLQVHQRDADGKRTGFSSTDGAPGRLNLPWVTHMAVTLPSRLWQLEITTRGSAPTQSFSIEDVAVRVQSTAGAAVAYLKAWNWVNLAGRNFQLAAKKDLQRHRQAMVASLRAETETVEEAIERFHRFVPEGAPAEAKREAETAIREAFQQPAAEVANPPAVKSTPDRPSSPGDLTELAVEFDLEESRFPRGFSAGLEEGALPEVDPKLKAWGERWLGLFQAEPKEPDGYARLLGTIQRDLSDAGSGTASMVYNLRTTYDGDGGTVSIPDEQVSARTALLAMALYLLDKSLLQTQEPFSYSDLTYLDRLIGVYNGRHPKVPLSIPSVFVLALAPFFDNAPQLIRLSGQLHKLPEKEAVWAVSLQLFLIGAHLSRVGSDGPDDFDIAAGHLQFVSERLKPGALTQQLDEALRVGMVRFLLFAGPFFDLPLPTRRERISRLTASTENTIRRFIGEHVGPIRGSLSLYAKDYITSYELGFMKAHDEGLTKGEFNVREWDPFLAGFSYLLYPEIEDRLFKEIEQLPVPLEKFFLARYDKEANDFLGRVLSSLLDKRLSGLGYDTLAGSHSMKLLLESLHRASVKEGNSSALFQSPLIPVPHLNGTVIELTTTRADGSPIQTTVKVGDRSVIIDRPEYLGWGAAVSQHENAHETAVAAAADSSKSAEEILQAIRATLSAGLEEVDEKVQQAQEILEGLAAKWKLSELPMARVAAISPEAIKEMPSLQGLQGQSVDLGKATLCFIPEDRAEIMDFVVDEFIRLAIDAEAVRAYGKPEGADPALDLFEGMVTGAGIKVGRYSSENLVFRALLRTLIAHLAGLKEETIKEEDLMAFEQALGLLA